MRLFQAFTNNSEAFKDQFCLKNSKKGEWNDIEEGPGNKIGGLVPEIEGCPALFSCFS